MPSLHEVEPAGSGENAGLAELAALSGVPLSNRPVSVFIGTLNNQAAEAAYRAGAG